MEEKASLDAWKIRAEEAERKLDIAQSGAEEMMRQRNAALESVSATAAKAGEYSERLEVALLQVREIREECAKIADSYKALSEDAWGAGHTYAAVVIARKIRESGGTQADGKCGHKLETPSERETLWDAKVSDLVCSIKACLIDGHVSERGAKVLQAAVDRTPAESLMWKRGEVTEKRHDEACEKCGKPPASEANLCPKCLERT